MKHLTRLLYILVIILSCSVAYGQSKPEVATEKNAVIQEMQNQLTVLSAENGELMEYCLKRGIQGEFVMDLTVQGKGKLLTIFMVSSSAENVSNQNMLKNKLMELQFSNIKLPKNERVKFRHTLTF